MAQRQSVDDMDHVDLLLRRCCIVVTRQLLKHSRRNEFHQVPAVQAVERS